VVERSFSRRRRKRNAYQQICKILDTAKKIGRLDIPDDSSYLVRRALPERFEDDFSPLEDDP